jgi:hypothetical protein
MVTKSRLKELGFETMADYFDYTIASWKNGNRMQTKELFHDLRPGTYVGEELGQKESFFRHFEESMPYDVDGIEVQKEQFKKYVGLKK